MTTKYWIKLYVEILDDPKMATLPDRLWRRTIELFMCAGKLGDDGNLPDVSQLAWLMRMNSEELLLDLKQITLTGIIKQTDSGWFISKFTDRQAPVTPTRRMQEYRDRTQKHQYYDDVTNPLRDVTQTQIQNRTEADVTETSHTTVTNLLRNVTDNTDDTLSQLQTAFINASGIPSFGQNDLESLQVISDAGCIPDDVIEAIRVLQKKKYTIKGVKSIEVAAINIAKQRLTKKADNQLEGYSYG